MSATISSRVHRSNETLREKGEGRRGWLRLPDVARSVARGTGGDLAVPRLRQREDELVVHRAVKVDRLTLQSQKGQLWTPEQTVKRKDRED